MSSLNIRVDAYVGEKVKVKLFSEGEVAGELVFPRVEAFQVFIAALMAGGPQLYGLLKLGVDDTVFQAEVDRRAQAEKEGVKTMLAGKKGWQ